LTDFTEKIDRNFTHLLSEQLILSNLFKISLISEISGSHLPFWDEKLRSLLQGGDFDELVRRVRLVDGARANADARDAAA
jgi:hypothetical protein